MFDLIVKPCAAADGEARRAVRHGRHVILDYDNFLSGPRADRAAGAGPRAAEHAAEGAASRTARWSKPADFTKLMGFRGLDRVSVDEAEAGDIIAIAGLTEATVPDTIGSPDLMPIPLPATPVDPPTIRHDLPRQ